MRKFVFTSLSVLAMAAFTLLTSCEQDSDLTSSVSEVENFVDSTMYDMQERAGCGGFGCYELVFPVSIAFEDGTTVDVNSYEELKDAARSWKEANPEATGRPAFVFPIDVLNQDGELITVESAEDLETLRAECPRMPKKGDRWKKHKGPKGHADRAKPCFELVFPLTVAFPDDTTAEAADREALRELLHSWKKDNRDSEERPEVVFPIEVAYEDGTTVTVNSADELKELKDSCAIED